MVVRMMQETGRPLSDLRRALRKFPQGSKAVVVRRKVPLEFLSALPEAVRSLEKELGLSGRVLVRYSGTEPKLRMLVEAPSEEIVTAGIARLVAAARADLEVV
jgi:phosphoglucosamine mutase